MLLPKPSTPIWAPLLGTYSVCRVLLRIWSYAVSNGLTGAPLENSICPFGRGRAGVLR